MTDLEFDPRLTDPDAARIVAERNRNGGSLPIGRNAGVAVTRARLQIPRNPDTAEVVSRDAVIEAPQGRELGVRMYTPAAFSTGCVLFFHGGGWMMGDLDTNDALCRELSVAARTAVVSVDYRLAPEHRYPAAIEDGLAALRWVAAGADGSLPGTDRIVVAGHSAGGNIAAVLAQLSARGEAPSVAHQLLLCAVLDCDLTRGSYSENATGLLMTAAEMEWYWELYEPDRERRREPMASPLRADDLSGVPSATLVVASGDPLRDEELDYADRLEQAGGAVETIFVPGVPHLFLTFPPTDCRDDAIAAAASAVRAALESVR